MLKLMSVAYWAFFLLSLPVIFPIYAAVWIVTRPFDRKLLIPHAFACMWGTFYIWACPIWTVKVIGREKISPGRPAVIVANHASLIDIPVLYALFRPFRWVSKAENFKVPFIGWVLQMNGYIKVRRGERSSVVAMMKRCREVLDEGIPVLFFPEGTRSKDGRLRDFKNGAFDLAFSAGCPVVPVSVSGTGNALPKHGLILRNRMDAEVRVLDPLDPGRFSSPAELREAARAAIQASLSGLEQRSA